VTLEDTIKLIYIGQFEWIISFLLNLAKILVTKCRHFLLVNQLYSHEHQVPKDNRI